MTSHLRKEQTTNQKKKKKKLSNISKPKTKNSLDNANNCKVKTKTRKSKIDQKTKLRTHLSKWVCHG